MITSVLSTYSEKKAQRDKSVILKINNLQIADSTIKRLSRRAAGQHKVEIESTLRAQLMMTQK